MQRFKEALTKGGDILKNFLYSDISCTGILDQDCDVVVLKYAGSDQDKKECMISRLLDQNKTYLLDQDAYNKFRSIGKDIRKKTDCGQVYASSGLPYLSSITPKTLQEVDIPAIGGYPIMAKESISSLGAGVTKINNQHEFDVFFRKHNIENFQLQHAVNNFNVYRVTTIRGKPMCITLQNATYSDPKIKDKYYNTYNECDLPSSVRKQMEKVAEMTYKVIKADFLGIDVMVDLDSGKPKVWMVEANINPMFADPEESCCGEVIAEEVVKSIKKMLE